MLRFVDEQPAPECHGIFLRRRRELVDETLGDERVLCDPDPAPEANRDAEVLHHVVDMDVRNRVRDVRGAVHPIRVEVGDAGLVLVEDQTPGRQPSGQPRFDLLNLLPGTAEREKIISVSDHHG